ncbi:hypothetical protein [Streptomyces sp. NPDC046805]|uniref:hypothetical protein n=1 Tax=Streptomyces sp. NPDC046805 TaxID=3155134 RepID=UPI0033CE37CD
MGGGRGGPGGEVKGGRAEFDINQCAVFGTDITRTALGTPTSSKITSGRAFRGIRRGRITVRESAGP